MECDMELFVTAARKKFRFQTARGELQVEDLWDMPLSSKDGFNLDALAIKLDELVDTKSFVKRRSNTENVNSLKLDIVKYVIDTKVSELEQAEEAQIKKAKKEKILAALKNKEDSKLEGMSEEDLRKELEKC